MGFIRLFSIRFFAPPPLSLSLSPFLFVARFYPLAYKPLVVSSSSSLLPISPSLLPSPRPYLILLSPPFPPNNNTPCHSTHHIISPQTSPHLNCPIPVPFLEHQPPFPLPPTTTPPTTLQLTSSPHLPFSPLCSPLPPSPTTPQPHPAPNQTHKPTKPTTPTPRSIKQAQTTFADTLPTAQVWSLNLISGFGIEG